MSLYSSFTPYNCFYKLALVWHMALQASVQLQTLISKINYVDLDVDVEDVKDILIVKRQQINAVQYRSL